MFITPGRRVTAAKTAAPYFEPLIAVLSSWLDGYQYDGMAHKVNVEARIPCLIAGLRVD